MSISTTFYEQSAVALIADNPRAKKTLLDWLIEARKRQAEAHVRRYMSGFEDETLLAWSLAGDQIASLRSKGRLPSPATSSPRASPPAAAVRDEAAAPLATAYRWIERATRNGILFIATLVARRAERRLERLAVHHLHALPDRLLKDVGFSRSEIDRAIKSGRQDAD